MDRANRSVGGASLRIPVKQDRGERSGKTDDKSGFHGCLSIMTVETLHPETLCSLFDAARRANRT